MEQEELRDYVKARLKVFYEEELDVPLVLFNEVLDHVLRIDRYVSSLSHPCSATLYITPLKVLGALELNVTLFVPDPSRIFRQPQGHLLLIGVSGAGKTTLSRFVAWMNGLSVYQIKVCTSQCIHS